MALFSRRKTSSNEPGPGAPPTAGDPTPPRARRRTVGQLLRETRESYGSDIARVAAALRIRASYLEAIENGRYDQLPGAVYAMGFVRAYAVHLGLDGDEAVRRFKLEAEGYDGQRDLAFPVPLSERSIPGWSMLLAALVLAVCGYGFWSYLSSTSRPRPERVSPLPAELAAQLPAASLAPESAPSLVPGESAAAPAPSPATAEPSLSAPAASPAPPAESTAPDGGAGTTATLTSPRAGAPTSAAMPAAAPAPVSPPGAAAPTIAVPTAAPPPAAPPASPPTPSAPALPPQVAAVPSIPPGGGATPVPDQPHVYGLANGETRILIRALSDSWIQVRDRDHVPIFTRQLHAGDVYHVPDRPGLSMRTGHGAGLEILVDGHAVPPIGGTVRPNVVLDPNRLVAGNAVSAGE